MILRRASESDVVDVGPCLTISDTVVSIFTACYFNVQKLILRHTLYFAFPKNLTMKEQFFPLLDITWSL
jgi:hypothetical protein